MHIFEEAFMPSSMLKHGVVPGREDALNRISEHGHDVAFEEIVLVPDAHMWYVLRHIGYIGFCTAHELRAIADVPAFAVEMKFEAIPKYVGIHLERVVYSRANTGKMDQSI